MSLASEGIRAFENSGNVITRITFRGILRGTIILGILSGFMVLLQGLGYVASYTTPAARKAFSETLIANPALGILYGDPTTSDTPRGYILYRCLAFLMLVGAIWGLLTATRLFRGQEDDGRQEMLLSGQTTARRAASRTMIGFTAAWTVAFALCTSIVMAAGSTKEIAVSAQEALFFTLCVLAPALLFFGIGACTSQLAANRRKATLFGLIPLLILYIARCVAHIADATWLQAWTPFGWVERARPIVDSKPQWLLPIAGLMFVFVGVTLWLAGRRDLGQSFIAESDVAQPKYGLLKNVRQMTLRLSGPILSWWLLGTVALAALLTSIAKIASSAVQDSHSIADALNSLTGGSAGMAIAFMSMATFFVAVLLMVMSVNVLGSIRREEARSYLDNILVRPVSRLRWISDRLLILAGSLVVTYIASSLTMILVAKGQGIALDASRAFWQGFNIFGPISIVIGIGMLLYGWKPRLATGAMYIAIGWSFLVDMVGSVVKLNAVAANSSLLHYIALVPAAQPDWKAFGTTLLIGLILTAFGLYGFRRRDLEVE